MKRMRNVIPYVVMVAGLTAVFMWFRGQESVRQPAAAVSVVPAEQGMSAVMLVDVRTPEEFHVKHREGAVNMPLDEIETLAPALAPDKSTLLLLYCRTGRRADQAMDLLKKMGYQKVENLHRTES